MPSWVRIVLAIIAGVVVWFVVATAGNLVIRWGMPGYAAVEKSMEFTLAMQVARLLLGGISSVAAGMAAAVITRGRQAAVYGLAGVLLALFIPVHVGLWNTFPLWYHTVFLVSLVGLVIVGGRFVRRRPVRAAGETDGGRTLP